MNHVILFFVLLVGTLHYGYAAETTQQEGLTLFYWEPHSFVNFGDYLSLKIVERMVKSAVRVYKEKTLSREKKLLAIGSILTFARTGDVLWGTGVNGKWLNLKHYLFNWLDVRSVRGPLTREFLIKNFNISCPEIYGDPALLFPYLFPEFKRKKNPTYDYIIIPHYSEKKLFPKDRYENVVYATDPWYKVINKILDSKFVISSSLHGIIIAEAFGIPARLLRVSSNESLVKYMDYYYGTGRPHFNVAYSIEQALKMGGEKPVECDLKKLFESFPFDYWPTASLKNFVIRGEHEDD